MCACLHDLYFSVTGALRTCDITIKLNTDVEHTFTSINKDDFPAIKSYLRDRNVRVKEQSDASAMRDIDKMDLGSEDDDDEEESARPAPGKARAGGGENDDEDSEGAFVLSFAVIFAAC
jgi:structure-specific recognition protein 1